MEESIYLTKEEALSIFAFYKYSPIDLIKVKKEEINTITQFHLYREIRWMLKIVSIYLSFKSSEVWYIVSSDCELYIDKIYKTDDTLITFKDLSFLVWFIFIHRNIKDYKMINKLPLDTVKLEAFRGSLLKLKAIEAYQGEMF